MSIIKDLRDSSPTTVFEGLYFIILVSIGAIMLLKPDGLLFIRGITIPSILDQPGWVAILIIFGSPCILLLTKFGIYVRSNLSA